MRLLLDTHIVIWAVAKRRRLPKQIVEALVDPDNSVGISAVSAWEIALKRRSGKLDFNGDFLASFYDSVRGLGFEPLGLTATHMVRGAQLDSRHKDPFDRMLAGQALVEGLTVVTADPAFKAMGVKVLWG